MRHYPCKRAGALGITRRGLIVGGAGGLLVGGGLGALGMKGYEHFAEQARRNAPPPSRQPDGMPGRYPGKVVEVRHEGAVDFNNQISAPAVERMVDRGMCDLTGTDHPSDAWRSFFEKDDVIAIKVNPVGRKANPGDRTGRLKDAIGSISSFELVIEIVNNLKRHCNVPPANIILFERYANEFRDAGYDELMRTRPLDGCRWYAAAHAYNETQVEIDGQIRGGDRDPNVVGYDPDAFVSMGFASPHHDPKDDRRHRSHLSMVVSRMANKIITIPVLKDHRSAGVTLALKNMSHGFNNNVARSHIGRQFRRDGATSGPNQCNTFIPTAINQPAIRQKTVLHIMDGLIAVYEGGPGCWNRTWGTWNHKSLFFATDPVAMDHVGWEIIDAKRGQLGWAPVAMMGQLTPSLMRAAPPDQVAALLANPSLGQAIGFAELEKRIRQVPASEAFNRRQPEHVILAGMVGLGTWDASRIQHRRVTLSA